MKNIKVNNFSFIGLMEKLPLNQPLSYEFLDIKTNKQKILKEIDKI